MGSNAIRKLFGSRPIQLDPGMVGTVIQAELAGQRAAIKQAQKDKDLAALGNIVSDVLSKIEQEVKRNAGLLSAAQERTDNEFKRKVIDTVAQYDWANEGFDLFGLLLKLLQVAGQELISRIAETVKTAVAPDLSDKVRVMLRAKLGREPAEWAVELIANDIESGSLVDWTAKTDRELETQVAAKADALGTAIYAPGS